MPNPGLYSARQILPDTYPTLPNSVAWTSLQAPLQAPPSLSRVLIHSFFTLSLSFHLSFTCHEPHYDGTQVRFRAPRVAYIEIECANTFTKVVCRTGVYGRIL